MATKAEVVTYTFTSPVRAGFLNVIEARAFERAGQKKGEPKFDGSFILAPDSTDLKALQTLCIAELRKLYPGKKLVARRLTQEEVDDKGTVEIQVPWKDGTKEADKAKNAEKPKDQEFFRGKVVLKASSKYAPALSGIENGKIVEYNDPATRPTLAKFFYSGAELVPSFGIHTYAAIDEQKPGGVALYLNAVCFIKHGPKIGGGGKVNAAEVFKSFAGTVSATDPGANDGMDDEIPF